MPPLVSVLVPALDEAANVPALVRALRETFDAATIDGEVVLVDDGSTDGTAALAEAELRRHAVAGRVLRHPRNLGKTAAILTAARAARGRWVVLLDADLQYAPSDIPRFLDALAAGTDLVTARKVGRYGKRHVSAVYNWLSRTLLDVPVRDCNSMKAMRREVLAALPPRRDWHRWLVACAVARGHTVAELDVTLHPRVAGRSKYVGWRPALAGARDLVLVWCHLRRRRAASGARQADARPRLRVLAGRPAVTARRQPPRRIASARARVSRDGVAPTSRSRRAANAS